MTSLENISQETWDKVESVSFTADNYTEQVGFTQVNHLVTLCGISDGAFRTYVLIRGLAQRSPQITWGLERLSILRDMHRATLSKHLQELEKWGLIVRSRRVGTSTQTHLPRLESVFAELPAQCISTALWGTSSTPTEDLKELVKVVADTISPRMSPKRDNECRPNATTNVAQTRHKEEEVKEKKPKNKKSLPAQEKARAESLPEPEYIPIDEEDDGFGSSKKKPKWQIPETAFQDEILAVCKRRWFRLREKTRVKALDKAVQIAEVLDDGGVARCLEVLEAYTGEGLPTPLPPIPRSWIDWRAEHARRHRWSFEGFLDALYDRDALVQHCRVQLRKAGVPVAPPDLPPNPQHHDWTPEEIEASLERTRLEHERRDAKAKQSSAAEPPREQSAVGPGIWDKSEKEAWAQFTGGK